MKWQDLLHKVSQEPLFRTGLLTAGEDLLRVRIQISRWVDDGKLLRLRKGIYALAEPYRKSNPHPFLVANFIKPSSYVSLQSALSFYSMIPEYVPLVISVTTLRPETISNAFGDFEYRHVKQSNFFGYELIQLGQGQSAFIATPEKALLDLLYLTPDADSIEYLSELRLQNLEKLNRKRLKDFSKKFNTPKIDRCFKYIVSLMNEYSA